MSRSGTEKTSTSETLNASSQEMNVIHQTDLKVLADLLHHLQFGFIGCRRNRAVRALRDGGVMASRVQLRRSDLISFPFSVQDGQEVRGEPVTLTHTLTHTLTRTSNWTKAHRPHQSATNTQSKTGWKYYREH